MSAPKGNRMGLASKIMLVFALGFWAAAPASAAPVCIVDDESNDEVGQRDLSQFCRDFAKLDSDGTYELSIYWDEPSKFSGGNSADACLVFDKNFNGNVDNALCVSVLEDNGSFKFKPDALDNKGAVSQKYFPRYYECKDTTTDNCAKIGGSDQDVTSSVFGVNEISSYCRVGVEATGSDPFWLNPSSDEEAELVVRCDIPASRIPVDVIPWNLCSFNSSSKRTSSFCYCSK